MARTEQHGAYAFIIYYIIYFFMSKSFILPPFLTISIIFFGLLPDFDTLYWILKKRRINVFNTEYQHHLHFWTHWPLSYTPLIFFLVLSFVFNFFIEFVLASVIGIFIGHFLFDSISSGDGIMWGKIPWKKEQFAPYLNLYPSISDGYHGLYWLVRYRKTIICKVGNITVIISIVLICFFQIYTIHDNLRSGISFYLDGYYLFSIIFLLSMLIFGLKNIPKKYLEEPPEGRYADYRISIKYISGLSEKNRNRHIKKYYDLLKSKGILQKIK